jgi:hypothetical protein
VSVVDNDDLSPTFSQDVYRTQVTEFYPLSVSRYAMLKKWLCLYILQERYGICIETS